MRTNDVFTIELNIKGNIHHFTVRANRQTNRRFAIEYVDEMHTVYQFQLVRTSIGRWATGGVELPSWLQEITNDIGKAIENAV